MDALEKALKQLNSTLSQKLIQTFEVVDKCDKNGKIVTHLSRQMEFKEDSTYYVSLIEMTGTSFFPNVTESNNKFYYITAGKTITLTVPTGAYDVTDYNDFVCMSVPKITGDKNPINISLHSPTGKVIITLATGYKIDFTKANTFREELGFESVVLTDPENISPNMADVVKVEKVYVSCDICSGSNLNGKDTNIIFSFANTKKYGYPLAFTPQKRQPKLLLIKSFNKITFSFADEDGNPVDFLGSRMSIAVEIPEI
jgi:hypothetical protein